MKKGEVDSKMMASLLSGVNRAYPYAKGWFVMQTERRLVEEAFVDV